MSMSKLVLAAAALVALASTPALADSTTTTAVPVRLGQNIVTIVLIIGVSVAISLGFLLWHVIPKIRSGELSLKNIDFDWRAELLNQTSRKEKERRAAEKARRADEMAAAGYDNNDESGMHYASSQPRVVREDGAARNSNHFSDEEEPTAVAVRRE